MAQYLKESVKQTILDQASEIISKKGFSGATMAEIAEASDISTGNLYRYFQNKDKLLAEIIDPEFTAKFKSLIKSRFAKARQIDNKEANVKDYWTFAKDHIDFCIANRHKVIILLSGEQGTPHAEFANKLIVDMVNAALSHFLVPEKSNTDSKLLKTLLQKIYKNYLDMLMFIFRQWSSAEEIHRIIEYATLYHVSGLQALCSGRQSLTLHGD